MISSNIDKKITCYFLISFPIMLYLYTLIHELGHGIIGILCGGKIDKIILGINARIYMRNEQYNTFTYPLMKAGGVLLPILTLFFVLLLYNNSRKNYFYHVFHGIFLIGIIGSLLAWVAIPFISLFTEGPVGEDATDFLKSTTIYPLYISIAAITIMGILFFIAYKKGLLKKLIELQIEVKNFRRTKES